MRSYTVDTIQQNKFRSFLDDYKDKGGIIVILPLFYWKWGWQNKKIQKFTRTSLNQYQQKNEPIDFNKFFKQDLQNHTSDFNGGLIGLADRVDKYKKVLALLEKSNAKAGWL